MKARQLIVVALAFFLVFSTVPMGFAQSETKENVTIPGTDEAVSKEQLVAKIKELFPGQFDDFEDKDFQLERHRYYNWEEDGVERYGIYFHKRIGEDYVHGNFTFAGESLELVSFYFDPGKVADAYFPPKVNEEEAQKIATEFLQKMTTSSESYQLREQPEYRYYGGSNRPLTEPVRYEFSFERVENEVPVHAGGIHVTVLGNGDVINFHKNVTDQTEYKFESKEDILSEEEVAQKINEDLNLELRYVNDFNYQTQEPKIYLVYQPTTSVGGVHAKDGNWYTYREFIDTLPASSEIIMLADEPLQAEPKPISKEEVSALAKKLLDPEDDSVELEINGVHEYENHLGRTVYAVDYTYYKGSSGSGSSFEIDKETGEIYHFNGYREFEFERRPDVEIEAQITYDEALKIAAEYAKELSPSTVHHYAYPVMRDDDARYGSYHFSFPRVENGVLFSGDSIGVGISSQSGRLVSYSSRHQELQNIPSPDEVVDVEIAKQAYLDELDIELAYVQGNTGQKTENEEFKLVYTINFGGPHYFDAQTGTWKEPEYASIRNQVESTKVTHPWAENELNFLIEAGILTVTDEAEFDANKEVTKGEALEIIVKSLTHYWEQQYYGENVQQTFENIDPNHPLYGIVERAVQMKIINTDQKTFAVDENVTRQELAYWFVRALQLHEAAKHSEIYHLDFKDANQVATEYKGYVALASALGVLTPSNGYFHPEREVTLAQLAVATFRLAETLNKFDKRIYY